MEIVAQVLTTGGILGLVGLILRWMWTRILKLEARHCCDLFKDGHQPRYVTTDHCNETFESLKKLLQGMDARRSEAKDLFLVGQREIENRLIAIETQLKGLQ